MNDILFFKYLHLYLVLNLHGIGLFHDKLRKGMNQRMKKKKKKKKKKKLKKKKNTKKKIKKKKKKKKKTD